MLAAILGRVGTRDVRWLAAAATFALGRGLSFLVLLVTLPLTLDYLGVERFAIWVVASSTIALFTLLEGGLGNGLILSVSRALGRDDSAEIRRQFSSAFFALGAIGAIPLAAFALAGPAIDWNAMLGAHQAATPRELLLMMAVIWCSFSVNFPVSFLRQFRLGLQQGAAAGSWETASNLAGFGGIAAAVALDCGLIGLAFGAIGLPTLVRMLHFGVFLAGNPEYRPRPALVSRASVADLIRTGAPMWCISVSFMIVVQLNIWLLGMLSTAPEVARYSVTQRYFMIGFMPAVILFSTLLPVLSEAAARGDTAWLRRRFVQVTALAVLGGGGVFAILALVSKPLMRLWIGPEMVADAALVSVMAVHYTLMLLQTSCSNLMLALGLVRQQAISSLSAALAAALFSYLLIPHYGSLGAGASSLLSFSIFLLVPQVVICGGILHNRLI